MSFPEFKIFFLLGIVSFSACETMQTVQPLKKEKLAKQEMKFDGDPLNAKFVGYF